MAQQRLPRIRDVGGARTEHVAPPSASPGLPSALQRVLNSVEAVQQFAWPAFVEEFSFLLLHVARSVTTNRDEAMDAYTHILEELSREDFHRLRGYAADPRSKFTTWLVVVARRICVDLHRSRYGRNRNASSQDSATARRRRRQLEDLVAADVDLASVPDESAASPEMQLLTEEVRGALSMVMGRLAAEDRLLLKLRFADGLTAAELARVLQVPSQFHVYRRINVLLAELRAELGKLGVESAAL